MAELDGVTTPAPKTEIRCSNCGSKDVTRDAVVEFNEDTRDWEIKTLFDNSDCERCEGPTKLIEVKPGEARPRVVQVRRIEVKTAEVIVYASDADLERIARDAADEIDFSGVEPEEFPTLEMLLDPSWVVAFFPTKNLLARLGVYLSTMGEDPT